MYTLLSPLCAGALALTLLTAGCAAPAKAPVQLTAQTVSVTPAASAAVDRAAADLGLSLLRQVRTEDTGSVLLSPLSAELALSLAANGAAGETLRQFDALLDGGTARETLNAACAERGCIISIPFMFLSFICLAAIPLYAITDKGFIDVLQQKVIDPILEVVE